jgi:phosphoglycolate phosphatase
MNILNKNYKLLIFDWDGTLGDSSGFIVNSFRETAAELGLKEPTAEAVKATFGKKAAECLATLYPDYHDIDAAADCFYKHYLKNIKEERLFDGAIELLLDLRDKGFKLALATNKRRQALTITLQQNNIQDLFIAMRCGDDEFVKPNPEVLHSLIREFDVSEKEAVMIGDTVVDMQVAKLANVDAIAACYGGTKKTDLILYSPVACIDNIQELKNILIR